MPIKFVAIDFETANARRNSACALGMVIYDNGVTIRKSWLIKPEPLDFHPFNIQIHGITPQMVNSAPTFAEMWHEVSDILESNIVVAGKSQHPSEGDLNMKSNESHIDVCTNIKYNNSTNVNMWW